MQRIVRRADSFLHPRFNRFPQLAQASLEKVVCAFDQYQFLRLRHRCNQCFEFRSRAELVARSTHKKLRLGAIAQEVKGIGAGQLGISGHGNYRRSHADRRFHSRICARSCQADRGSERKSSEYRRQVKFVIQPVERRADVVDFAGAIVMLTLTESSTAKIEAQHGKTKTVQRLHGVKHDFVVQRTAKERMRMANDRCMGRVFRAGIQQRLKSTSRPADKERSDGGIVNDHNVQTT
jgi:hypothetical protein